MCTLIGTDGSRCHLDLLSFYFFGGRVGSTSFFEALSLMLRDHFILSGILQDFAFFWCILHPTFCCSLSLQTLFGDLCCSWLFHHKFKLLQSGLQCQGTTFICFPCFFPVTSALHELVASMSLRFNPASLCSEVRLYSPLGLPVRDPTLEDHPKVKELRAP